MKQFAFDLIENYQPLIKKHGQFITFLFVGLLNTLFGYSLFAFFIFLGLQYPVAVFLATVFGVLFNFKTTGAIVFKNKNQWLIFQFVLLYTILYFVNIALISLFQLFWNNLYFSGALATLILPFLSFYFNKNFVFANNK